jgi:PAS domain S-box-containing protein
MSKTAASRLVKAALAIFVAAGGWVLVSAANEPSTKYAGFMPHGYCYLWDPGILWLNVISDGLITLSYYAIPVILVYFIRKNRNLPFNLIFWMFGTFILACGTTHLMEIWNVWHGSYLLAGLIKGVTAAVSVFTAAMLIPLVPKVMLLPDLVHLQATNRKLEREIAERKRFDAPIDISLRRKVNVGFIAAVLLTLFVGYSSWRGAQQAEQDTFWVSHTHEVMQTIERTSRDVIQAETSAGAFALTGQEPLLLHYQAARDGIYGDEDALQHLTADNLSQQQRLDALRHQVSTAIEFAESIIAKRRKSQSYPGAGDALEVEKFLDVVRNTTRDIYAEEARLLVQRSQTAQAGWRLRRTIAIIGAVLGAGLWLLAKFAVKREIRISAAARTQLSALNAELEHRVEQRTASLRSEIAGRKRVERANDRASRELADQEFALNQHAMVTTTDLEGTITYVNDKFCTISQYSRDELIGENHRILNSAHHSREFFQQMYHEIANGQVWRGEICNRAKDGSIYWVDSTIIPFLEDNGKPRQYMAIRADITERKRAEEARERLAAVVESSDDAIISKTLEGTITSWNRGAERVFGYSASEAIGKPMLMLFPPERVNEESDILERIRQGGSMEHFETLRIRKDGRQIDISATISPIKDGNGAIVGASKIARDITERKQAEKRLAAQAEELALSRRALEEQDRVLDLAQVIVRDMESRVVLWRRGTERLYGYTAQEALGIVSHELLHTQLPEPLETVQRKLFENGVWEGEVVHTRRDGSRVVVMSVWVLYRDDQAQPVRILEVDTDITARKQAEEMLAAQTEELSAQAAELVRSRQALETQTLMLRSVLNSMVEGLVAVDKQGKFVIWNPAAEKIVGLSAADLSTEEWTGHYGLYLNDKVTPFPAERNPLFRAIHGEVSTAEMYIRNPKVSDGVWVEASASPLKDRDGLVSGGVVAFRDITQRKADEEEIRQLNEELEDRVLERTAQLEAANQELEAFTYSVSHDLRAPLRHIGGFSRMLVEEYSPSIPPEARQHLQRIEDGVRRMGLLIDELLDLARVGRHPLKLQPARLNSVIDEVISLLQPDIEGRTVTWKIADLPPTECDPILIKQVFQNLIANALKFTRPRACAVIEIGSFLENGRVSIFVRDNGVGFNMKYKDKLFGVFQRLHRAEEFEGTGIGLATVQRVVRKHGGRVWAESELDKSATFWFTLATADKSGKPGDANSKPLTTTHAVAGA